jgi:hypothetical protein
MKMNRRSHSRRFVDHLCQSLNILVFSSHLLLFLLGFHCTLDTSCYPFSVEILMCIGSILLRDCRYLFRIYPATRNIINIHLNPNSFNFNYLFIIYIHTIFLLFIFYRIYIYFYYIFLIYILICNFYFWNYLNQILFILMLIQIYYLYYIILYY